MTVYVVIFVHVPSQGAVLSVLLPSSSVQKRKWSDSERESDKPITNIGRKRSEWQSKNIINISRKDNPVVKKTYFFE
jgi:hypothetical protein